MQPNIVVHAITSNGWFSYINGCIVDGLWQFLINHKWGWRDYCIDAVKLFATTVPSWPTHLTFSLDFIQSCISLSEAVKELTALPFEDAKIAELPTPPIENATVVAEFSAPDIEDAMMIDLTSSEADAVLGEVFGPNFDNGNICVILRSAIFQFRGWSL